MVSPSLTVISFSTPALDAGISIDALSDSTVMSDCSTLITSPTLTSTSMTVTSLKSPMSGTRISTGPALEGTAGDAGDAVGCATSDSVGNATEFIATGAGSCCDRAAFGAATSAGAVAGVAASAVSRLSTTEPCLTLSPSCTRTALTTPAALDGISIEALSDSTVSSDWSASMLSPGLTSTSMTVTSSKSPISGT